MAEWTCSVCTFVNDPSRFPTSERACNMCETARPQQVQQRPPPPVRGPSSHELDHSATPLPADSVFPFYSDWVQLYDTVKNSSNFREAVEFCIRHPGAMNNRKQSITGNSLLHQAGYWGALDCICQ